MLEKMADLDRMIEERPKESMDFFTELFVMLRGSFTDLKTSFTSNFLKHRLHLKVLDVLVRELERPREESDFLEQTPDEKATRTNFHQEANQPDLSYADECLSIARESVDKSGSKRLLVLQVCTEIITFLCRSCPNALVRILGERINNQVFQHYIYKWILAIDKFPHQILDLFRIQPAFRSDKIDEECLDYFIDELVPSISAQVKAVCAGRMLDGAVRFLDFAIELYILLSSFRIQRLSASLQRHNFVQEVSRFICESSSKKRVLRYLKFLREHLSLWKSNDENWFDLDIVFDSFVKNLLPRASGRNNLLRSVTIGILNTVADSECCKVSLALVEALRGKQQSLRDSEINSLIEMLHEKQKYREAEIQTPQEREIFTRETEEVELNRLPQNLGKEPSEFAKPCSAGLMFLNHFDEIYNYNFNRPNTGSPARHSDSKYAKPQESNSKEENGKLANQSIQHHDSLLKRRDSMEDKR